MVWRQSCGHSGLKTLLRHPVLPRSDGRDAKFAPKGGQKASAESYDPGVENMGNVRWITSEWMVDNQVMSGAILLILLCILGGLNSAHFWSLVVTTSMSFSEGLPRVVTWRKMGAISAFTV